MTRMQRYMEELKSTLMKYDVGEFRKFVLENKNLFGDFFVKVFCLSSDDTIEATMHKLIFSILTFPEEVRQKSEKWLLERGYNTHI